MELGWDFWVLLKEVTVSIFILDWVFGGAGSPSSVMFF
jgi:hypothetical protein